MNNAISHMKIQEGANLSCAFAALGLSSSNTNNVELSTTDELDITPLELEKADNIDNLLADALVNVNATGIKLNPNITYLEYTFTTKNGYVKGILDIDYSNIEEANQFLPAYFYKNENLKAILGDTNKVIKFSKPPKKINASGEENVAKSAHASPNIFPVNSYTRFASASPRPAAIETSRDVISSIFNSRNKESSSLSFRNSRAVRATPVAEQ